LREVAGVDVIVPPEEVQVALFIIPVIQFLALYQ
jgi:hypothetical protein